MKKVLLALAALLLALPPLVRGTSLDPDAIIAADTALRYGTLSNGMSYYIRHNDKPAGQAEFYLVYHVGAMQEEDSQQGLAHFLEHMAFNGTKNMPGKMIIDYLESVGVKFGANLNASTGLEQTIYNMSSVPTTREGIIDTAMLILHDWAAFITLDPSEIDKERGVIIEELRTRQNASWRLREKTAPIIFNNSKYAHRNVIGHLDFLKTFPYSALTDFYHRWYYPANEAVIIVGDIDPAAIEAKLRRLMSDIPAPKDPAIKQYVPIPGNGAPQVGVVTDPEQTSSLVSLYIKRDPLPITMRNRVAGETAALLNGLVGDMAGQRLDEIVQRPGAPFVSAGMGSGSLVESCDVFYGMAVAREGEEQKAFAALYTEVERIRRFGFTAEEFERARSESMSQEKQYYDNRGDRRSNVFVRKYINAFTDNGPLYDPVSEWKLDSAILATVDLESVNDFVRGMIYDRNQVVVVQMPQKEGLAVPSEASLRRIIDSLHTANIVAYMDSATGEPLVKNPPKGSKVKKESRNETFGATEWTLGNGIKVVVKQTDFKADEILLSADTRGGLSALSDDEVVSGRLLADVVSASGVGTFPRTQLSKMLSGKMASVGVDVSGYSNSLSGSSTVADLETMLQLVYLYFTAPRFDKEDFDVLMDRYNSALLNARNNPRFIMQDSLLKTLYGGNIRREAIDVEVLSRAKYEQMASIYAKLFGNPGDFTFVLVGSLPPQELKPLVEKYIGGLPAKAAKLGWRDDKVRLRQGEVTNRFTAKMEMPKTTVSYTYNGAVAYNMENVVAMSFLQQILDIRCTESVREEKGGTYGVSVSGSVSKLPNQHYTLSLRFDTNVEMADELQGVVEQEIARLAKEGAREDDLSKVREFMLKQQKDNLKKNGTWLGYLDSWWVDSFDRMSGYEDIVARVTSEKIKALASKVLSGGNLCKVIMEPAR